MYLLLSEYFLFVMMLGMIGIFVLFVVVMVLVEIGKMILVSTSRTFASRVARRRVCIVCMMDVIILVLVLSMNCKCLFLGSVCLMVLFMCVYV